MAANQLRVVRQVREYLQWRRRNVARDAKVGLVATKGALHDGHLALVRQARLMCDVVIVTIMVVEAQFASYTDYERFPRRITGDIEKLREEGVVDLVVAPNLDEVYRFGGTHGAMVRLESDLLPRPYTDTAIVCGECTALVKMVNLIQPTHIFYGQRDLMRTRMMQRLLEDLLYNIDFISIPTVRTSEGVACDARLLLLSTTQVMAAEAIYRALCVIVAAYLDDHFDAADLILRGQQTLEVEPSIHINHVRIAHPYGFQDIIGAIDSAIGAIAVISVSIGEGDQAITLTDNVILAPRIPAHEQSLWNLVKSVAKAEKSDQPSSTK